MDRKKTREPPLAAVVAVADYEAYGELPRAKAAAERLADVLAGGGYNLASPTFLSGGKSLELAPRLDAWFKAAPNDSILFVYWTGHGKVSGSKHYLICSNSPRTGLSSFNAFATDTLGSAIAQSRAEKALLIVDTCYSGAGAISVIEAYNDLLRTFPTIPGKNRTLSVIASSHPLEEVVETIFLERLLQVLTEPAPDIPWTDNTELLRADQIAKVVQERLISDGLEVAVESQSVGLDPEFILNPRFTPDLPVETAEQAMARTKAQAPAVSDLFVGRKLLLNKLHAWFHASSGSLAIVTGPPGSGKSAVIRKLTSQLPESQVKIQSPSASPALRFDAVLSAKGRTAEQLARLLGQALKLEVPALGVDFDTLIASIAKFGRSVRLAIDELDEAAPGEALLATRQFLASLSELPSVWLLLGTLRRIDGTVGPADPALRHAQLRELFGQGAQIFDLSDQEDAPEDIRQYVLARLSLVKELAGALRVERVASDVARLAEGNFLYASIVSRSLLDHPHLIGEQLPESAVAAFEADLTARFSPDQKNQIKDLIATLAWSEGAGLPRSLWPRIATLLSGRAYTDADITWLLRNAAFHVLEAKATTRGIQQTVYRIFHQRIAEHLLTRQ